MRINYNVSSIIAKNAMNNNDKRVTASTKRLSSGYKINSAADNAAGLAIARRMNAQIKSLQEANQSANDGLSALNTADGAMAEIHDILQRMNELAIQSANGTNADSDREMIQKEIDQLVSEIDRIAETTEFNSQSLLDGSFAFKAYANIDNVKVMSHTEGVATGTYVIGQLKYSHYEDTTTRYSTEETKIKDPDGKVVDITYEQVEEQKTEKERYEVNNDKDLLKDSLVTSASIGKYETDIDQIKAFPEGSKVTVEDENIVIKAQGNFEIKISVNDRTPIDNTAGGATTTSKSSSANNPQTGAVDSITTTYKNSATGGTVVTTTSFSSVECYRNIAVKGDDGKRYNIGELNFFKNVDSAGDELAGQDAEIYTDYRGDNGKSLKDDFAEYFKDKNPGCAVNIDKVEWDEANNTFSIEYTTIDGKTGAKVPGNTASFELYKDTNEYGAEMATQKTLDDFLYTKTMTTCTEYTIGNNTADDCLKIDVTGMGAMIVQVGANAGQYMELEIPSMSTANLGVDRIDLTTEESARLAIDDVSDAIVQLSAIRSRIGAYSNRLEHTITNLDTTEENITSAYSRIMDVDMAAEMTEYSTVQVLVQASTSMLAQANERPQQVLQLLQ
jgi:flagellin